VLVDTRVRVGRFTNCDTPISRGAMSFADPSLWCEPSDVGSSSHLPTPNASISSSIVMRVISNVDVMLSEMGHDEKSGILSQARS
jgi:hypothetical protein